MPRKARIDAPGALHHIIVRGIKRQRIFSDDQDRDNFVKRLGDILTETQTACFAWALIPNHAHILLRTGQAPLATVMRRLFGRKVAAARKAYRAYVDKGVARGRRPELVGGGLVRSAGGWSAVKAMRRAQDHMKSDERILGDGEFTQAVLDQAQERLEERYRLKAHGYDLEKVTMRVSSELGIDPEQVWRAGKHPLTVKARSLLCYWAVRKLGFSATELSKKLGISQPSVSISVKRGDKIAKSEQLELIEELKFIILWAYLNFPLDGDSECDVDPDESESQEDGFTAKYAFFGGFLHRVRI